MKFWVMIGIVRYPNGLAKANYILGYTSDKKAFKDYYEEMGWKRSDIRVVAKKVKGVK